MRLQHSKVGFEHQWNGFCFVFRVLSGLYFSVEEYENSIRIAKYVKHIEIKRREGTSIPEILDEIADDLEHMGGSTVKNIRNCTARHIILQISLE